MVLKYRGSNTYCYHSVKRDGQVHVLYMGSGQVALLAEQAFERDRAERRAAREARLRAIASTIADLRNVQRQVTGVIAQIDVLFVQAMNHCGWSRHNRGWRGRKTMGTTVQAIEKARRLFDAADDVPALIEKLGGKLARRVQERLVERLSSDPLVQESIRREAEILRRELEGDRPTVIERLIVERIVVAWLGWRGPIFWQTGSALT